MTKLNQPQRNGPKCTCNNHYGQECWCPKCHSTTTPTDCTTMKNENTSCTVANCTLCNGSITPTDWEGKQDTYDEFMRDVCSVVPKSKSEVRRRLYALIQQAKEESRKEYDLRNKEMLLVAHRVYEKGIEQAKKEAVEECIRVCNKHIACGECAVSIIADLHDLTQRKEEE